jgi:hypothetical protein
VDHEHSLPRARLAIAIVAAFLSGFPRAMAVTVIIIVVVVVFSDEFSNEEVHDFTRIRPQRRDMWDCMINLADVLVALTFRVPKGVQSEAAPGK